MNYETHEFEQGSEEWDSHRGFCHNASELSAAAGGSKNTTRSFLIECLATGREKEFSDFVIERVIKPGHVFESLARPLAEELIGEELYPSVLSVACPGLSRRLGASLDGKTMDDSTNWEHKRLNAELSASLDQGIIPTMYHWQMEQGMMINGAKRCLFSASDWDDNNDLIDIKHCWYESNPELRAKIVPIWKQVEEDVANYKPVEVIPAVVAESTMALPALFIHAKGEITTNNMTEFGEATANYLAGLKKGDDLVTDQDFANAKEAAKDCREAVKALRLTKSQMLAQTVTIGEACDKIDKWEKDYQAMALALEKDVERETENRRVKIMTDASKAYTEYVASLEVEISPIKLTIAAPNFAAVMKGKKSIKGWEDAVNPALSNGKIAAAASAKDLRDKLTWKNDIAAEYGFLFSDLQQIIHKPFDDFKLLVETRIANHKAEQQRKLEAEREKIRAEEQAKAQREAAEKAEAERKEQERIAEAKAKAEREAAEKAAAEKLRSEQIEQQQRMLDDAEDKAINAAAKPVETIALGASFTPITQSVEPVSAQASAQPTTSGQRYSTTTFRDDGVPILLNADGKRSVFCDIDQGDEPTKMQEHIAFLHNNRFTDAEIDLMQHYAERLIAQRQEAA